MERYGKPSASWFKTKRWFFDQDRELLDECKRIAQLYIDQPIREHCKVCHSPIEGNPAFSKHGIGYHLCEQCGHLNGAHEDTDFFCEGLYKEEESDLFSRMYNTEGCTAFEERRDCIYLPKAHFLVESLQEEGMDPATLVCADFGAGSGYFVSALKEVGVKQVKGYEVSETQVRFGNSMFGEDLLQLHQLDQLQDLISTVEADVISLVFVLEHVQDPMGILRAIRSNPCVQHVFIAVPMFSTAVFVEMAFPHFAQRHLTCGHTHLFTPRSVDWMCTAFDMERTSEWWFGADMIDMYRMIYMTLARSEENANMVSAWEKVFLPVVDAMQLELDRRKQSSEVHFLARINR